MASKGGRRKGKPGGRPAERDNPQKSGKAALPEARALPTEPRRTVDPVLRRRGQAEIAIGVALLVGGFVLALMSDGESLGTGRFFTVIGIWALGVAGISAGASRIDRRVEGPVFRDPRRWIYGFLAGMFAIVYALLMWKVIPNRLPSAMLHLSTVPLFTLAMSIGAMVGGRYGWWLGVVGGSLVLLSTIILIARILASAAFLAGVYGAFGKAASTFALVSVALIVEAVGILPICQVKFLMSRAGRRSFGVTGGS